MTVVDVAGEWLGLRLNLHPETVSVLVLLGADHFNRRCSVVEVKVGKVLTSESLPVVRVLPLDIYVTVTVGAILPETESVALGDHNRANTVVAEVIVVKVIQAVPLCGGVDVTSPEATRLSSAVSVPEHGHSSLFHGVVGV